MDTVANGTEPRNGEAWRLAGDSDNPLALLDEAIDELRRMQGGDGFDPELGWVEDVLKRAKHNLPQPAAEEMDLASWVTHQAATYHALDHEAAELVASTLTNLADEIRSFRTQGKTITPAQFQDRREAYERYFGEGITR